MTLLRRFVVIAVFAYWQGGFTFYAAVVVPIGTAVLGSAAEQARITRQVAPAINLAGAVALVVFALDIALTPGRRRGRGVSWLAMAILLAVLVAMLPHLDRMFHGDAAYLDDRAAFRPWHRTYLWLCTIQWAFGVVFLLLTLAAWRSRPAAPDLDARA